MQKIIRNLGMSTAAAIIAAAVIIGIALYVVQTNKQQSIERQQQLERLDKQEANRLEREQAELRMKQDECKALSSGVKERWNNVMGVTYDESWEECVVTYTDTETGKVEISPLKYMQNSN